MRDERVIQSYVYYQDKVYFVSTIERDSSALLNPCRYNETIVWEFKDNKKGEMLMQEGDCQGSIEMHNIICTEIYKNGVKCPLEEAE